MADRIPVESPTARLRRLTLREDDINRDAKKANEND